MMYHAADRVDYRVASLYERIAATSKRIEELRREKGMRSANHDPLDWLFGSQSPSLDTNLKWAYQAKEDAVQALCAACPTCCTMAMTKSLFGDRCRCAACLDGETEYCTHPANCCTTCQQGAQCCGH